MRRNVILALIVAIIAGTFLLTGNQVESDSPVELSEADVATFAGGCFWCMEAAFESIDGVIESISGYTGGHTPNPTYEQVNSKTTGHLEVVQVYYNPSQVTYNQLLDVFWRNIDPTDAGGQFVDRGEQYTTAIFYSSPEEKELAKASKQRLDESERFSEPVVTEILELEVFYEAEEYHQDYYRKSVVNYRIYERLSGREEFKKENWGE